MKTQSPGSGSLDELLRRAGAEYEQKFRSVQRSRSDDLKMTRTMILDMLYIRLSKIEHKAQRINHVRTISELRHLEEAVKTLIKDITNV